MAARSAIVFGSATAVASVAALVIMTPKLPGIASASIGTALTFYAAPRVRQLSDTVALAVLLLLALALLAWVVFIVDVVAHGGFQ